MALEFTLILGVFLSLVFGILEFGRAYNAQIALQGASREGARALALNRPPAEVSAAVRQASPTIDRADLTIAQTPCTTAGTPATVNLSLPFQFLVPDLLGLEVGAITLRSSATMRCGL